MQSLVQKFFISLLLLCSMSACSYEVTGVINLKVINMSSHDITNLIILTFYKEVHSSPDIITNIQLSNQIIVQVPANDNVKFEVCFGNGISFQERMELVHNRPPWNETQNHRWEARIGDHGMGLNEFY